MLLPQLPLLDTLLLPQLLPLPTTESYHCSEDWLCCEPETTSRHLKNV
jgi:hypothetical protein